MNNLLMKLLSLYVVYAIINEFFNDNLSGISNIVKF